MKNQSTVKNLLGGLQWALYMISTGIVMPVVIGQSYHLSPSDASMYIQVTLLCIGLATITQAVFGHRLPINETPCGLWFGIFTMYATIGVTLFGSESETLRVLEFSLILCGVFGFILNMLGVIEKLEKYFTPTVVGTNLLLLVALCSKFFFQAMTSVYGDGYGMNLKVVLCSVVIIVLTFFLMNTRLKAYSVLISIVVGWGLYTLLGLSTPYEMPSQLVRMPRIFPFGPPQIELSMIITSFLCTLLLVTNLLSSMKIAQQMVSQYDEVATGRTKQAGSCFSFIYILLGCFGVTGLIPTSEGGGFVVSTGMTRTKPLIIGGIIIAAISFFPPITSLLSMIPESVGYAALFVPFVSLCGFSIECLEGAEDKKSMYQTVGLSVLIGIGIMNVPGTGFTMALPAFLSTFLSNGLIVGTIIALIMEVTRIHKKEKEN